MTLTSSTLSVVVIGGMNPLIHSPGWYRFVGLISDEEHEQATKLMSFVTPPMARVQLPTLVIQCEQNRWEAQTNQLDAGDRLAEIAGKVFDDLLKHTPVEAYGFNCHFAVQAERSVERSLLKALKGTGLTSGLDSGMKGQFAMTWERGEFTHRLEVSAPADNTLLLASNFHHPIRVPDGVERPGFFAIGPHLKSWMSKHREEAMQQAFDYPTKLGLNG